MANWGKIFSRGDIEDRRSYAPVAIGGISLTGVALLFSYRQCRCPVRRWWLLPAAGRRAGEDSTACRRRTRTIFAVAQGAQDVGSLWRFRRRRQAFTTAQGIHGGYAAY